MVAENGSGILIRMAQLAEQEAVMSIIKELDLEYDHLQFSYFWVAVENGEILSVLRLEEFADFLFLSALGTKTSQQGRGVAAKLITTIQESSRKDIYLYTIIPAFFAQFGFTTTEIPPKLPRRELFDCQRCQPKRCACMVFIPPARILKP